MPRLGLELRAVRRPRARGRDNLEQTTAVVAEAHGHGAHVEGEIEGIEGVEDDIGSDDASTLQSLEVAVDFITKTGVDVFAPAIGNAHGQYKSTPKLNHQRVTDLVEATNIPMALHGGTGLSPDQFRDLISRGCAKANISTAIKETYMRSALEHLKTAEEKNKWDPPTSSPTSVPPSSRPRASTSRCSADRAGPGEGSPSEEGVPA